LRESPKKPPSPEASIREKTGGGGSGGVPIAIVSKLADKKRAPRIRNVRDDKAAKYLPTRMQKNGSGVPKITNDVEGRLRKLTAFHPQMIHK